MLLLGGGTSFVAQKSLPGDVLYPIKIHVNENVESLLAMSPKTDAEVAEEQAARRVLEADQLKAKGLLTEKLNSEIIDSFESKIVEMNKHLAELDGKGDTQFVSELKNKLDVELDDHFETFTTISANATNTPTLFQIFQRVDDRHKGIRRDLLNEKNSSTTKIKMEDGEDDEVQHETLKDEGGNQIKISIQ